MKNKPYNHTEQYTQCIFCIHRQCICRHMVGSLYTDSQQCVRVYGAYTLFFYTGGIYWIFTDMKTCLSLSLVCIQSLHVGWMGWMDGCARATSPATTTTVLRMAVMSVSGPPLISELKYPRRTILLGMFWRASLPDASQPNLFAKIHHIHCVIIRCLFWLLDPF